MTCVSSEKAYYYAASTRSSRAFRGIRLLTLLACTCVVPMVALSMDESSSHDSLREVFSVTAPCALELS